MHRLQPARTLIISLGANDVGINTEGNIRSLRTNAQADRVFWLLPSQRLKPRQVEAVQQVAREFGDMVIPRPETNISADGVHPTYRGYKLLGDQTR
jgi:lysophospholipase L1-like esterase